MAGRGGQLEVDGDEETVYTEANVWGSLRCPTERLSVVSPLNSLLKLCELRIMTFTVFSCKLEAQRRSKPR